MQSKSIPLLAILLVLTATLTAQVDGKCIVNKGNKRGESFKVEIALSVNKSMSPGYVILAVHNENFTLFKVNETVIPQVMLLLNENTYISDKTLKKGPAAIEEMAGLKNYFSRNQPNVWRYNQFKDPAPDQTVKLNALLNEKHTMISILGVFKKDKVHFYGTKDPIQLCLGVDKPLTDRLPSTKLTSYKLINSKPFLDNSVKPYGTYKITKGTYWNLENECFPKHATVTLDNGRTKEMGQLEVGDRVAVGNGDFSEVFMFTHQLPHTDSKFVQLSTTSGNVLKLTPGHFIPVNGHQYKPAKEVRLGDTVRLMDGSISTIIDIKTVVDIGLYNPQTTHGDIVVDGVVASTYTTTIPPKMAHALLAPLRGLAARFAAYGGVHVQTTA